MGGCFHRFQNKKYFIAFISARDDFAAQSAGSMLTALITLHPEEASGWNITVIVATFPEGVAWGGGVIPVANRSGREAATV